mgnify:CR=1 FL=1
MKKTLLLTGASGEIGFKTFTKLVNEDFQIIASCKRGKIFSNLVKSSKIRNKNYEFIPIDLSNINATVKQIQKIIKKYKFIECFVNCAGVVNRSSFLEENIAAYEKLMNINFISQMMIIKQILPEMINNKAGKIVSLSSQMAKMPHPNAAPSYEVSKSSINTLFRHLVFHYAKHNINFNIVAPGTIKSPMQRTMKPEKLKELKRNIPSNRFGSATEVSELISFLLSNKSNYINGAQVNINGGSYLD